MRPFPHFPRRLVAASFALAAAVSARAETTFYQARIAPILDRHCVSCHGPEKQKAKLRLDSFDAIMRGAESGVMVKPGDARGSELFRRITLPASDDEVMPTDGKPLLSKDEIRNIELWIAGGASASKVVADFPGAPPLSRFKSAEPARAPDWRPRAAEIATLEERLHVRLVPRSQVPTDGLVLRTASAPSRCDDSVLAALAPVAPLIVEAELARTRVTDAGLAALASWENLRAVDLTRTAVTSAGLAPLARLRLLETLNLTDTAVDDSGVAPLRAVPSLRRLWLHGTKVTAPAGEGG
ncbi:MAG: c-type cytochrome domain-containing protein [Opitutaceae bacterium]